MRIIPDLIRCPDCKFFTDSDCKASTTPCPMNQAIEISDAQMDEIGAAWVKEGGHKKWLVGNEGGKFRYEQVKPLSKYLAELISLTGEGKQ